MTPYAITITRQFGSKGREIGKQLAERLHCHYYDRSAIEQEAAQKDESLAALVALKQVEGYYKMAYPLGIGSSLKQEKMFQAQSEVLLEHAAKENCVIVGRCADYALADNPDCFSVFVHANLDWRINRIAQKYNKNAKEATFLNILLGIYCKSGIQPWILAKNLSSECYIGIDVCRENNMSTAGLIQVVGKDGRVLKCKTISVNQNGEKIDTDLLKSIVSQAKELYKSTYNKDLKHIVFHRDGISREDLEKLKEITQSLEIDFEYIEVTKNINRRMAMLEKSQENYNSKDKENKKWITEIGMCFEKENEAYLITTNPSGAMGMARPLRIKKVYGHQSMQNIIEDVYKLSFMHIGSIMKSRLPITTHYADLSSIYSHRDFMPKKIDTNILHFI